jgi:formate dehydrogenase iron-sulfur subunit
VYGLPPDPIVTTRDLPHMYKRMSMAAAAMAALAVAAFAGGSR